MATDNTNILKGVALQQESDKTKTIVITPDSGSTTNTTTTITAAQTADRTVTLPDFTTTLVGTDSAQAISNKTSIAVDNLLLDGNTVSSTNGNGNVILDPNGTGSVDVSSARITSVGAPTGPNDAVNKTYADNIALGTEFTDVNFAVHNDSDVSKTFKLDLSTIATGQTRTWIVPNLSSTFLGTDSAQDISNKTSIEVDNLFLDGNTISSTDSNGDVKLDPNGNGFVLSEDTSAIKGTTLTTPSGGTSPGIFNNASATFSGGNLAFFTSDRGDDGNPTGSLFIETGNKTLGGQGSGAISIKTGTTAGTRGNITVDGNTLFLNGNSIFIDSLVTLNLEAGAINMAGPVNQDNSTTMEQIVTPVSNPPSGSNAFYPKSDNQFYNLDSDGNESVFGVPTGTSLEYNGRTSPSGFLMEFGQQVSRTTYSKLYNILCPSLGTFTVTIATPAVVTIVDHQLNTGERIRLFTDGALPTGLTANTDYFVINVNTNTFRLATTRANALAETAINTSGSQSGTHTAQFFAFGAGDGSTTFHIPDSRSRMSIGADAMGGTAISRVTNAVSGINAVALGDSGGDERVHQHTHTQDAHKHRVLGNTGGPALVLGTETDNFFGAQGGGSFTNGLSGGSMENTTATNQNFGAGSSQNMPPAIIKNRIIKT